MNGTLLVLTLAACLWAPSNSLSRLWEFAVGHLEVRPTTSGYGEGGPRLGP